jgi:hypothetical protein
MKLIPVAVMALALATPMAACSEDSPAVCSSVDSLETSVDDVQGIELSSPTALSDLERGLTAIGSDLSDVKADAKAEFSTQVEAVQTSYDALTASVDGATASTTAATLASIRDALSTFGTDVQTLITDVKETC